MNRQFYVYELVDSRTNIVFYVGKGHGSRIFSHVSEAKRIPSKWNNVLKCERINKILTSGYDVQYKYVEQNLNEQDAFEIECNLMNKHGFIIDKTGTLTNIRRNHLHHKTLPQRKYKSRAVVQFSLEGNKLNTFPSIIAATAHINKKFKTNILNCCHKRRRQAYGFVWRFENELFTPVTEHVYHTNRRRAVIQKTTDGKIVATYKSIREAARLTKISSGNICFCCKGKIKSLKGFLWEYL